MNVPSGKSSRAHRLLYSGIVHLQRDAWATALGGFVVVMAMSACSSESGSGPADGSPPAEAAADGAASEDAPARDASHPDSGGHDASRLDASGDGSLDGSRDASSDMGSDVVAPSVCPPDDGGMPNDLLCTGLYSDWASKTIASDVSAYTPSYLLWSDGAQKSRWVYLPPNTKIDTTDMDDWVFPVGTKVWKEFSLGGQIIETRLLWKVSTDPYTGWNVLDYFWSSDGTSATLNLGGETNVNGTTYEIPSQTQCYTCHSGRKDLLLGVDLVGLGAPGGAGLRLSDLVAQQRLTQAPPATTITIPEDSTGKAAAALGYLHINCGASCHNTNSGAQGNNTNVFTKLLAAQLYPEGGAGQVSHLDTYTTTVNVTSPDMMPENLTWLIVKPGDSTNSLLVQMSLTRTPLDGGSATFLPMPPIISHQPDTAGFAAVTDWINAL
jgi:hypothetical protein